MITTPQAKGVILRDDALCLGAFDYGHGPGHRAVPQADVVLAVGSRLHLTPSVSWGFQQHQTLIHMDADPDVLGKDWPTSVAITSDAACGLQALTSELGVRSAASEWRLGRTW